MSNILIHASIKQILTIYLHSVVVYCCFHKCRIPRTKQEIEADLMRSDMTNKFRDHLQNLPPETATFIEGLYILMILNVNTNF